MLPKPIRAAMPLLLAVAALAPAVASAATYTVDTPLDLAPSPGAGACPSAVASVPTCSLRTAITLANAQSGASTIQIGVEGLVVRSALPTIQKSLTVIGNLASGTPSHVARRDTPTVAPGAGASRQYCYGSSDATTAYGLFQVGNGTTPSLDVKFQNLIICHGSSTDGGAAIRLQGSTASALTLDNVRLINNSAGAGNGGAVWLGNAAHEVLIKNSSLSGNTAAGGGAVYASAGTRLNVVSSTLGPWFATGTVAASAPAPKLPLTVAGNEATGASGGGALLIDGARLIAERSFFVGNTATKGAAIAFSATALSSTLIGNTLARNDGAALSGITATSLPASDASPFLGNVIADNAGAGCDTKLATGASLAENAGYNVVDGSCDDVSTSNAAFTARQLSDTENYITGPVAPLFWDQSAGYGIGSGGSRIGGFMSRGLAPSVLPLLSSPPITGTGDWIAGPSSGTKLWKNPAIDRVLSAKIKLGERGKDARGADTTDGDLDGTAVRDAGAYEFGGKGLTGFQFGGFSVSEPTSGDVDASVQVGNYVALASAVAVKTVDLAIDSLVPGTALPDIGGTQRDYAPFSAPLSFGAVGDQQVKIKVHTDTEIEADETVNLVLTQNVANSDIDLRYSDAAALRDLLDAGSAAAAAGAFFKNCTIDGQTYPCATDTLVVKDPANKDGFRFSGPDTFTFTATEGAAGSAPTEFTLSVQRRGSAATAAQVSCQAVAGTALAGTDYLMSDQTLKWAAGDTAAKTCKFTVINDAVFEADEKFTVKLVNPTAGYELIKPTEASVVIKSNNPVQAADESKVSFLSATANVAEGGVAELTLHRDVVAGFTPAASVVVYTQDGSAVAPRDYTAISQTVSWAAGDIADKKVQIPVNEVDGNRSFTVRLCPAGSACPKIIQASPEFAVVTIVNAGGGSGSSVIQVSKSSVTVREGGVADTYTIKPVSAPSASLTVAISASSSAVSLSKTSLTFAAGSTAAQEVSVTAADNATVDGDRSVTISNAAGGETVVVTASVLDNDSSLAFATAAASVNESAGTVSLVVTRTGSSFGTATATVTTGGGTATAGSDFTAPATSLSFANGETTKALVIPILADSSAEADETFDVTLSAPLGADGAQVALGSPVKATVTIVDSSVASLIFSPSSPILGEGQTVTASLALSKAPTANVVVALSAPAGLTVSPGTLTFTPANFATTQAIQISAAQDSVVQGSRTVTVGGTVSSADTAYSGKSAALSVTITDDDNVAPSTFTVTPTSLQLVPNESNQYTVKLSSSPSSDVVVSIATPAGLSISPSTLSFSAGTTSLTKTVTVLATANPGAGQSAIRTIVHTVTTSNAGAVADVNVTVTGTSDDSGGGGGAFGLALLLPLLGLASLRRKRVI